MADTKKELSKEEIEKLANDLFANATNTIFEGLYLPVFVKQCADRGINITKDKLQNVLVEALNLKADVAKKDSDFLKKSNFVGIEDAIAKVEITEPVATAVAFITGYSKD